MASESVEVGSPRNRRGLQWSIGAIKCTQGEEEARREVPVAAEARERFPRIHRHRAVRHTSKRIVWHRCPRNSLARLKAMRAMR